MKYQIEEIRAEQLKFCNKAKLINCEIHKQRLTSFDFSPNVTLQERFVCEDCPKKNRNLCSFKEAENDIIETWNKNVKSFNTFICQLELERMIICLKKKLKSLEIQIKTKVNNELIDLNKMLQEIEKRTVTKIHQISENMKLHDQVQKLNKQDSITRTDLDEIYDYLKTKPTINMQQQYFQNIQKNLKQWENLLQPFKKRKEINLGNPILNITTSIDLKYIAVLTYKKPFSIIIKNPLEKKEIDFILTLYGDRFNEIKKKNIGNFSQSEEISSYQMKFSYDNKYITVNQLMSLQCSDCSDKNFEGVLFIETTKFSQFEYTCDSKYLIVMQEEEKEKSSILKIVEIVSNSVKQILNLDGVALHMSFNKKKGTLAVLLKNSVIKIYQQNMDQLTLLNSYIADRILLKIEFDLTSNYLISLNSESIFLWDSTQLLNHQAQPLYQIKLSDLEINVNEEQIQEACYLNSDNNYFYISIAEKFSKHKIIVLVKEGLHLACQKSSSLDLDLYFSQHKVALKKQNLHLSTTKIQCQKTQCFNAQSFCLAKFEKLFVVNNKNIMIYYN